jgi:hypothetical protein
MRLPLEAFLATLLLAAPVGAQIFVPKPSALPSGPFNSAPTMQVDFADVDLDGDWDAALADGGASGNFQSRLWINQGGQQGSATGTFVDETATRLPTLLDQTRDVDFADIDGDGDADLYCVDTSVTISQPSRFWINVGGLQGGNTGFYVDETATRWIGLGQTGSSIWPALVLAGGGFISRTEVQAFADLDGDGDLDLVASAFGQPWAGKEPTRLFLNDGLGHFEEFNPSGFQLTSASISEGDPGLWCEGVQDATTGDASGAECSIAGCVNDVDVGDIDGDLDLDFLNLRAHERTRVFTNRSETGSLVFRDTTSATFAGGQGTSSRYEQEVSDLDLDGDLDVYGLGWIDNNYLDATLRNNGQGVFGPANPVFWAAFDVDAAELLDYDDDGRVDLFRARFEVADRLYRNDSQAAQIHLYEIVGAVNEGTPAACYDVDTADVDGDGDSDLLKAHTGPDQLLVNVAGQADSHAPRIPLLEQPPDQDSGGQPVRIRAHVLDNAVEQITAWNPTTLYYEVDGGPTQILSMRWMGGQVFHADLPGSAYGNVKYFAVSLDVAGNQGKSALKSIDTSGGCSGQATTYCMGLTNSAGCTPGVTFKGAPSASAGSGFELRVVGLVPNSVGLFFYSKTGSASQPFAGGLLCVAAPLLRTPGQGFGGSGPCGGQMVFDFNAYIATGADPALVADTPVFLQAWARDAVAPSTISLSNGLHFTLCP